LRRSLLEKGKRNLTLSPEERMEGEPPKASLAMGGGDIHGSWLMKQWLEVSGGMQSVRFLI
jgi:hypothetical protein